MANNFIFTKMHGLGNDFVVLDRRGQGVDFLTPELVRMLSHRKTGIGCDQLLILQDSLVADVKMTIYNADGGLVSACGNATRCIALMILRENGSKQCVIETESGNRYARYDDDKVVVNMGKASFNWQDIPTSVPVDTGAVLIHGSNAMLVNVGNPHCVFVVQDLPVAPVTYLGAKIENDPLFPQRTNVEWIQIINHHTIKMRVWERGVGETDACGTGACAVVACANKAGLVDSIVDVEMPGGILSISIADDVNIWMSGQATFAFTGVFQV